MLKALKTLDKKLLNFLGENKHKLSDYEQGLIDGSCEFMQMTPKYKEERESLSQISITS